MMRTPKHTKKGKKEKRLQELRRSALRTERASLLLSQRAKFSTNLPSHLSGLILFQEDLNQPASRLLTTRRESCQVPAALFLRASNVTILERIVTFRITFVWPTVISTHDVTAKKEKDREKKIQDTNAPNASSLLTGPGLRFLLRLPPICSERGRVSSTLRQKHTTRSRDLHVFHLLFNVLCIKRTCSTSSFDFDLIGYAKSQGSIDSLLSRPTETLRPPNSRGTRRPDRKRDPLTTSYPSRRFCSSGPSERSRRVFSSVSLDPGAASALARGFSSS